MPWFPDFVSAVELSRQQRRVAGRVDPVGQYFKALEEGDAGSLESVWPGHVVIYDPRAAEVRGHRQLRAFVRRNQVWLSEHQAESQVTATTRVGSRAVVELLAELTVDGQAVTWPVAVVAESPEERSVVFRTYCSQWPVDGQRHLRPPILDPGQNRPGDVVGRYLAALDAGDTKEIVKTFAPGGYLREAIGPHKTHRGSQELDSFFSESFGSGGGIALEPCEVTDDGAHCALEYNCTRWGSHDLPPQAGLMVFERGPDGLLAAVRVYDDVVAP